MGYVFEALFDLFLEARDRAEVGMLMAWVGAGIFAFLLGFVGLTGPLVLMFIGCVVAGLIHTATVKGDEEGKRHLQISLRRARQKRAKRKAGRARTAVTDEPA